MSTAADKPVRRFPIVDSLSPQSGGLLSWTHYRKLLQVESDNPTLGIILCADTDSDIARYSMLHGSEQRFASKYKLLLPSEEELRAEIEAQKMFWIEQHGNAESIKPSPVGKGMRDKGDHAV